MAKKKKIKWKWSKKPKALSDTQMYELEKSIMEDIGPFFKHEVAESERISHFEICKFKA